MMEDARIAATGTIDEEAIKKGKLDEFQAQTDATNSVYADRLAQSRVQGQGRLGSSRAFL